jgi:hypothetical protein
MHWKDCFGPMCRPRQWGHDKVGVSSRSCVLGLQKARFFSRCLRKTDTMGIRKGLLTSGSALSCEKESFGTKGARLDAITMLKCEGLRSRLFSKRVARHPRLSRNLFALHAIQRKTPTPLVTGVSVNQWVRGFPLWPFKAPRTQRLSGTEFSSQKPQPPEAK